MLHRRSGTPTEYSLLMSVNRQALVRDPIPIRPNSSRGEYIDHPFLVGRGGLGTYAKAYNWVTESRGFEPIGVSSGRGRRLTCDSKLLHALEDIRCLCVLFERKHDIFKRSHPDREWILPGQGLRKPSDEGYQRVRNLSIADKPDA